MHKIFVWTRQVVLTNQQQRVSLFLRKNPPIHLLEVFPPALVKQGLSAPFQNGILHVRTSSCVCLYNKHQTSPTSLNTSITNQKQKTPHSPPCGDVGVSASGEIQMLGQPTIPTTIPQKWIWTLGNWHEVIWQAPFLVYYNPTGCIDIYRIYRYRTAALPAEVCTWPHKRSTAANCSPELSYNSTPIQTSQHLPRMKHAFVLG